VDTSSGIYTDSNDNSSDSNAGASLSSIRRFPLKVKATAIRQLYQSK